MSEQIAPRGDVEVLWVDRGLANPRYVYSCPVCGYRSRPNVDRRVAQGRGLEHEEHGWCSLYTAGRLGE